MTFPDDEKRSPVVVCNPSLTLSGRLMPAQEGCLSLPGVFEQVYRAAEAWMTWRDPLGSWHEEPLTGYAARVAQHEADHLDGIMFFNWRDRREGYATAEHPEPWARGCPKTCRKASCGSGKSFA